MNALNDTRDFTRAVEAGDGIAIVGMSCRFAGARGLDAYWDVLRNGTEAIRTLDEDELRAAGVSPTLLRDPDYVPRAAPLEDMACFDGALFGFSPREASILDPQHRHFLECIWEALEDAAHDPRRFAGAIGVFAGSGHNAYMPANLLTNPQLVREVGSFLLRHTGNDKDFMTTRASYLFDFTGPSINVQTACSTSLVAIHMAAQSLLAGECDMALAGGASIELPHGQGYLFEPGGILSPDGHCRPFDADAEGTVFGSGVAVTALRRLEDAIADADHIYAVLRGSAINNDGAGKVGYLAPSVDGQARAISEALEIGGADPSSIDYVEAHGTGTRVGDPIELAALSQAFARDDAPDHQCGIGSVKANIGHTDTAAGAAGLIKVALALHHEALPPTINHRAANPECGFDRSPFRVVADGRPWPRHPARPRRAGVSSLGVGGTNAHAVLEEAPARPPSDPSRAHQLIAVTARTPDVLDANGDALAAYLQAHPEADLADAAYSLCVGRQPLGHRRIVVATDAADAARLLEQRPTDRCFSAEALAHRQVAFLFSGAGSQHVFMARGLLQTEPAFARAFDACIAQLERLGVRGVREAILPDPDGVAAAEAALERPSIALPALFTIQVALARFWMSLGIAPSGMIGHSSGEYAAAHLSGALSLEAALRIVSARGRLFEQVAPGGMLSVPLPEAELRALLTPDLCIAAINGPQLCVASGPAAAIAALRERLDAQRIESQPVRISVAAHSGMLDPILASFRDELRAVELRAPTIPFVSNLTGDWITAEQATDPDYWVRHLRQTVRFTDGLQTLLKDGDRLLLEVGPGRGMASLARQHPDRAARQPVLNSMRHPTQDVDDQGFALMTLGQMWALGVAVDWSRYWGGERRLRIPLPTYRFERQRHWIEPGVGRLTDADDPQARRPDIANWVYAPEWRRTPAGEGASGGPALVFADEGGVAQAVADRLRASGAEVATVRRGRGFRRLGPTQFAIDPTKPGDYERLLEELAAAGHAPTQVYHCWQATGRTRGSRRARLERVRDTGFHALLAFAPVLARHSGEAGIDVALVSDHLHRVTSETGLEPEKALASGAAQVVAAEYPELRIRTIDLDPVASFRDLAATARLIVGELAAAPEPAAIAIRAGERWVRRFTPMPGDTRETPAIRRGGLYLVTGGLGGIGLTIARHLTERHAAHVVLLARTALPPRAEWDRLIARRDGDPKLVERIQAIRGIEALGGAVEVAAVDVTDPRALRTVVQDVTRRRGPIDGVFHTAGVLDDAPIAMKTAVSARKVLDPKVLGTLAIEEATRGHVQDFIVLFSSISAFAGLAGQADYAAANAFLDSVAQARRGGEGPRILSIGWSQWDDVGMTATRPAPTAEVPLAPGVPLDHPFLASLHRETPDRVTAAGVLSPALHWLLDDHRMASGQALIPGAGYLELARATFAAVEPGPAALSDVAFLTPFSVADGQARELRVTLNRDNERDWRFCVLGRAAGPGGVWTDHASGCIRAVDSDERAILDVSAIHRRCADATPVDADPPQLRFGPRWNVLRRSFLGAGEALLFLELPPRFFGDLDEIGLHPALLDMATAGAQALIRGRDPTKDFYAPLAYRRCTLHAPLPANIVSHVRYQAPAREEQNTAVFAVTIADMTGRVVAEIEGFTMVRIRDAAAFAPDVRAENPASDDAPAGPMTAAEGMRVLDRLLAGARDPHLVVSPFELTGAIERLTARAAAVAPTDRRPPSDGDAPPLLPTEQIIADLWKQLLGTDDVRRGDNFFDLGGHSLLAVQFINRLRQKTGKSLPLAALMDDATVGRLAGVISPEESASGPEDTDGFAQQEVVLIRRGTGDMRLFLIHDGLGETLLYRGLAMLLDPAITVLGIEPARAERGGFRHTAIAEMAADYIGRMRRVQPHGPYLVAGLCAGGVIAFEIARQLEDLGEFASFVGLIDAADVDARPHRFHQTRRRLARVAAMLRDFRADTIPLVCRRAWNMLAWEVESRLEFARRRRTVAQTAGDRPAAAAEGVSGLSFLHLYEVAHRAHRPQGTLSRSSVVLFKASCGNGADDDTPYQEVYRDVVLGWGKRAATSIEVHSVPGGHSSILQEPNVRRLAEVLQPAIDAGLARDALARRLHVETLPLEDARPAVLPQLAIQA